MPADERTPADPAGRKETLRRIAIAASIAIVIPVAAVAVYVATGARTSVMVPEAAAPVTIETEGHEAGDLSTALDRLRSRLAAQPDDLDGWMLLGRTLIALERLDEAKQAYQKALTLAPTMPELHAQLGELMVIEADGSVTEAALGEFAKAADDPRARYYIAEAAIQRGDIAAARAGLTALLTEAPEDAPWREIVAERLAEIESPTPTPPASTAAPQRPPGPTAADVAAAQSMSADDRQAMIRGMVERLAARLEKEPDDKEGWARLANAYEVLGETEKAEAARARATQAKP